MERSRSDGNFTLRENARFSGRPTLGNICSMVSQKASPSSPNSPTQSRGHRELWAALLAAAIGVPAVFLFTRAMADSEARRREAPIRAVIGDAAFEQLMEGEKTPMHYYGHSLSAPDFELEDQHGKPYRLSKARGKVVVMNFWTITCQPCVQEMPSLVRLAALAEDNPDLEVIAVTTDKQWSEVAQLFPPDSKLKVLFDPQKQIVRETYGSRLFPETWIVDAQGVIRLRVDGPRDWSDSLSLDVIDQFM